MSGSKHSVQYPAPTGPYKVSLRNNIPWRELDRVRVQISVGKAITEGDKFFAFCEWVCTRFGHVSLIVSDTLQRHNFAFEDNLPMAGAWAVSRSAGDAWLQRNCDAINLISSAQIVRWDSLLADPRHAPALERLEALYQAGGEFTRALDATIANFWQRNAERLGGMRRGCFDASSRAFLLEELAVFSFQCADPAVDAYAGSWLETVFTALRAEPDTFFDGFRRDWLQVDFTRNKAFVPDLIRSAA